MCCHTHIDVKKCVLVHTSVYSHDVHRDGRGQALADVFEEVIGGQQVGTPRNQVLLELQQLSPPTQKHLTHKQKQLQCHCQIRR